MSVILHKYTWFRFINIFLSTFDRLRESSVAQPPEQLCYDTTYLKLICLCANEGFYFVRENDADHGKRCLICSDCPARAADIEQFLNILTPELAGTPPHSAALSVRFSRQIKHALRLFHRDNCRFIADKKKASPPTLSLLNAFEIVRQLARFGLFIVPLKKQNNITTRPGDHHMQATVNITCRICFINQAVLAMPCGHIFQCMVCWGLLIGAADHDNRQPVRLVDNTDTRDLRRSNESKATMTIVHFLGDRKCPLCRSRVWAVQHVFV